MERVLHLISGGLDSVTLLYDLKRQGKTVFGLALYYGQPHSIELVSARMACERLGVSMLRYELPGLGGLTPNNPVVPFRNALFLAQAVNSAIALQCDSITIGCNADDAAMFPDCRRLFLDAMQAVISASGYKTAIVAPYLNMTKRQIASRAAELGVPLGDVWSCYVGGLKPCGKCLACQKLDDALGFVGYEKEAK